MLAVPSQLRPTTPAKWERLFGRDRVITFFVQPHDGAWVGLNLHCSP